MYGVKVVILMMRSINRVPYGQDTPDYPYYYPPYGPNPRLQKILVYSKYCWEKNPTISHLPELTFVSFFSFIYF